MRRGCQRLPDSPSDTSLGRDSQIHRDRRVCLHFALVEITIRKEIASDFAVQPKFQEARIGARPHSTGYSSRSLQNTLVEDEEISPSASRLIVKKWDSLGVNQIIATIKNVKINPHILLVLNVFHPCRQAQVRLQLTAF